MGGTIDSLRRLLNVLLRGPRRSQRRHVTYRVRPAAGETRLPPRAPPRD